IYAYLLTTASSINNPDALVRSKIHFDAEDLEYPDFDIAILCTCRQFYAEALPVLYGGNRFHFDNPESLQTFRSDGLVTGSMASPTNRWTIDVPVFNFKKNPPGRLTLVKKLCLTFRDTDTTTRGRNLPPETLQRHIFSTWKLFFHQRETSKHLEYELKFPALEDLTVDCRGLALEGKCLFAAALVAKFKTTSGLRKLAVAGVEHEKTLNRLKKGLLRDDGTFVVL
ncbi:MAG: hypothetical protein Q9184_008532, partial [Pyrenodesmia sp. 2 TL-2023]